MIATGLLSGVLAALLSVPTAGGIRASAPDEVHVDRFIPVTGTVRVDDGRRRPVRLQELVGEQWYVMARDRSSRSGRFGLTMRSGPVPQVRTLRVVAPPRHGLARAATRPFDVRIFVMTGRGPR